MNVRGPPLTPVLKLLPYLVATAIAQSTGNTCATIQRFEWAPGDRTATSASGSLGSTDSMYCRRLIRNTSFTGGAPQAEPARQAHAVHAGTRIET